MSSFPPVRYQPWLRGPDSVLVAWVDASDLLAGHALAPDLDPFAQFASMSIDGDVITLSINNSAALTGTTQAVLFDLGDLVTVVPGFKLDGQTLLSVDFEVVASPPDGSGVWIEGGVLRSLATPNGRTSGFIRPASANEGATSSFDTQQASVPLTDELHSWGFVVFGSAGTQVITSTAIGVSAYSIGGSGIFLSSDAPRLVLTAGCNNDSNTGPHSCSFRLRFAASPIAAQ